MSYRNAARRALESSGARAKQNLFIQSLSTHYAAYQFINNVDELIATLRDVSGNKEYKDALLLALIIEYQSRGGMAFALLASAMFPVLDKLYRSRVHRFREHDDLWGRIVGSFAEALEKYPVERRPAKVAANIEGETMAALRKETIREKRGAFVGEAHGVYAKSFAAELSAVDIDGNPLMQLGDLGPRAKSQAFASIDGEEYAQAEAALEPYLVAGNVNREDRFLILGVNLYEKSLGDLAKELGITRDAAKKRHTRAMEKLRATKPKARFIAPPHRQT